MYTVDSGETNESVKKIKSEDTNTDTHFRCIWFRLCIYSSRSASLVSQIEALSAKLS